MIDTKRLQLLLDTAERMGLEPVQLQGTSLVALHINGQEKYVFHKSSNPNNAVSTYLTKNKHAARLVFERHGLPNIPFAVPKTDDEAIAFVRQHGRVIVKPIRGQHSSDIHLVNNVKELGKIETADCIFEKFIKGQETRLLVAGGKVQAVHLKVYEDEINDPRTVRRVSLERSQWNQELMRIAEKAAQVFDLRFTAVDFLVTESGEPYLLEINAAPGIDRFHYPTEGPVVDAMGLYLKQVIAQVDKPSHF